MKTFDLVHSALSGTNLIEASAGTGKTYTIAGLYLRLILEHRFSPDQILVVTFTNAATEELKGRIRDVLVQAQNAFSSASTPDAFINTVIRKYKHSTRALQLIKDALVNFDKAAIYTIHGFCQRILFEYSFETGSLFDTELVTDPSELIQEIADDFWRTYVFGLPPELISYVIQQVSGPDYFYNLLAQKKSPKIKIVPDIKKPLLSGLEDYRKTCRKLKNAWPNAKTNVSKLLKDPALSGTSYGSCSSPSHKEALSKRDLNVFFMIEAMDQWIDAEFPVFPLFKGFEKFTSTKIKASTRKKQISPTHEIFDICDDLDKQSAVLEVEMQNYLLFLKTQCFKFADRELAVRKKNTNIQFFDDLLLIVKKALEDQENALARAVRHQYKAALVDEFQDTDAIQYEIFSRIFASKQHALFMIGDPKQSIYSFRGADIFSYIKGARQSDSKYTLIENWRSDPGLLTAINTIFSNVHAPFVFNEIPFVKSVPGQQQNIVQEKAPLTLWYLFGEQNKTISKAAATSIIARATAAEISRLIAIAPASRPNDSQADITPGDIAVLVRTNRQAQIVKKYLSSKGIPSVLYNAGNVFLSPEAVEIERVLLSISEPGNERLLKSALVTDILGFSGKALDSKKNLPFCWEDRFSTFRGYLRLWRQYGFIRMIRQFMAQEKVRGRLLEFPDGERRLTNLLHLTEILHKQAVEKQPGINGLIKWLAAQRQSASSDTQEHQLRLESDELAVQIVTIHKSKGLEYPIVFCPFGWESSLISRQEVSFHDNAKNDRLTLDIDAGRNHDHKVRAQLELLAENLRLLYVALTRARKCCYLVWGRFNTAETSALAYLLHWGQNQPDNTPNEDIVSTLKSSFSAKKNEALLEDLRQLACRSEGTIAISPLPLDNGETYDSDRLTTKKPYCRQFSGNIDTSWKISSYSYLVSKRITDDAVPDRDAGLDTIPPVLQNHQERPDFSDIFLFPKGTRTGIFFHDVFEHLDYASRNPGQQKQLVADKLNAYGFDPQWQATVCTMIKKVLAAPLQLGTSVLNLSDVQPKDRINEMQFYFPVNIINPRKLTKIFEIHSDVEISDKFPEQLGRLSFPLTKGFMKGYVDLICCHQGRYILVDWKSNYLGPRLTDYNQAALGQIMSDEYYILQYHLYVLALNRYLRIRVPNYRYETDFGGVFYLFIRGVDSVQAPGAGIYKHLPSPEIIKALDNALIPKF